MKADGRFSVKVYCRNKKPTGRFQRVLGWENVGGGLAVVADGFDGAAFHGFFAQLFFVGRGGLFVNDGVTAIVIAFEVGRGGFATEIAINALIVDEVFASGVFGVFVCCVSHKIY